jgi:hypothetical protein
LAGGHSFMKSTRNRAHLPPKIPAHKRPHCSYPACRGTSTDLSTYSSRFGLLVYMPTKLNPVCLLDLKNYGYRACTALTQDNILKKWGNIHVWTSLLTLNYPTPNPQRQCATLGLTLCLWTSFWMGDPLYTACYRAMTFNNCILWKLYQHSRKHYSTHHALYPIKPRYFWYRSKRLY